MLKSMRFVLPAVESFDYQPPKKKQAKPSRALTEEMDPKAKATMKAAMDMIGRALTIMDRAINQINDNPELARALRSNADDIQTAFDSNEDLIKSGAMSEDVDVSATVWRTPRTQDDVDAVKGLLRRYRRWRENLFDYIGDDEISDSLYGAERGIEKRLNQCMHQLKTAQLQTQQYDPSQQASVQQGLPQPQPAPAQPQQEQDDEFDLDRIG